MSIKKSFLSIFFAILFVVINTSVTFGAENTGGGTAAISISPNPVPNNTNVIITIKGTSYQNITDHYHVRLKEGGVTRTDGKFLIQKDKCVSENNAFSSYSCTPPTAPTSSWVLTVTQSGDKLKADTAYTIETEDVVNAKNTFYFTTGSSTSTDGSTQAAGTTPTPATVLPICSDLTANGKCTKVNSSIGILDTDINGLISRIVQVTLGLSGGIFLLLIIRAGYRMISSQGNPEAIKDARESLTSAIVGFLFLIFSFVILELIGVHLLQLPGLS